MALNKISTTSVLPVIAGALVFGIGMEAFEIEKDTKYHVEQEKFLSVSAGDLTYSISSTTTNASSISFVRDLADSIS